LFDEAHFASLLEYDLGHDLALLEVDPASIKRYVTRSVAANPPSEKKPVFNFGPALNRRALVIPGNVDDARVSFTEFLKARATSSTGSDLRSIPRNLRVESG
jgi:hypothetical protein